MKITYELKPNQQHDHLKKLAGKACKEKCLVEARAFFAKEYGGKIDDVVSFEAELDENENERGLVTDKASELTTKECKGKKIKVLTKPDESGMTSYTDEAQNIFDAHYDEQEHQYLERGKI